MDNIKSECRKLRQQVIDIYQTLHRQPELSGQETKTGRWICDYLKKLGYEPLVYPEGGIAVNLIRDKSLPTLMLRADIDALPVSEQSCLPFSSCNPGVMHACGHDAHTAMLLIAARIIAERQQSPPVNLKLVFQAAEESSVGAANLIKQGILTEPPVTAVSGIHIWSGLPSGSIGLTDGPVMAGLKVFEVTVIGRGGHTGLPQEARDPIIAAADIILGAQRVQTRQLSSLSNTTIVFGQMQAGTRSNIIPDEAKVGGTIRFLSDLSQPGAVDPAQLFVATVKKIAASHDCRAEITFDSNDDNIAVINAADMVEVTQKSALEALEGDRNKIIPFRCTASEDFSEYSSRVPSVFYFLGCGNPAIKSDVPHHNPRFLIDPEVLPLGVEMHLRGIDGFAEKWRKK